MSRALSTLLIGTLAAISTFAAEDVWWPEPDFPGPDSTSAPDWLTSRKLCFSRWDGGRLEVSKGFLSGWNYFNPPWPDVIDATTRWYDPDTVELARAMGYNFLWLTFSNGFSIEQERGQWRQLEAYVRECHRHNIQVAAYMSSTNLFVDDMFARVPESRTWLLLDGKGEPVPYGAADYSRLGRTTRMLADLANPEWRAYLKRRIDAAIDAGFDAIEYDNTFYRIDGETGQKRYQEFLDRNGFQDTSETRGAYVREQMRRLFRELLDHARQRKPDMVIFVNLNRPDYTVGRACTIISTEDGTEPGYYEQKAPARGDLTEPVYEDEPVDLQGKPFNADLLRTNLPLLRLLKGLSEGWKPVLVEFGGRRNGDRFLNQPPPLAFQLAVGECNAALCSYQGYQEGRALLDLYRRKPEVMPIVHAARAAHDFVKRYETHALGARYKADVALVIDDRLPGQSLMNRLTKANVQYEVLLEDGIRREVLERFQRVLVCGAKMLSGEAIQELTAFAETGGRLMLYGECGTADAWGQPRAQSPFNDPARQPLWSSTENEDEAARFLTEGVRLSFEVLDRPWVLFTLTERPGDKPGEFVAHLLNYHKFPLENVRIRCREGSMPRLLSLTPGCDRIRAAEAPGEWIILGLGVYSMVLVTAP